MRFIYTGGCWLFGPSRETITTEQTPFAPLPAFAWGVTHCRLALDIPGIHPIVIHPAMVYEPSGGVFSRFHSADLAALYRLALERSDPRETYLGAAIDGLPVGRIARAFARRFGTRNRDPEVISAHAVAAELGEWARGYGLDQRQSGEKARRRLGWEPKHLDPESEVAAIV
jgi:nucleoside-diphosphate-sugar epimerase